MADVRKELREIWGFLHDWLEMLDKKTKSNVAKQIFITTDRSFNIITSRDISNPVKQMENALLKANEVIEKESIENKTYFFTKIYQNIDSFIQGIYKINEIIMMINTFKNKYPIVIANILNLLLHPRNLKLMNEILKNIDITQFEESVKQSYLFKHEPRELIFIIYNIAGKKKTDINLAEIWLCARDYTRRYIRDEVIDIDYNVANVLKNGKIEKVDMAKVAFYMVRDIRYYAFATIDTFKRDVERTIEEVMEAGITKEMISANYENKKLKNEIMKAIKYETEEEREDVIKTIAFVFNMLDEKFGTKFSSYFASFLL